MPAPKSFTPKFRAAAAVASALALVSGPAFAEERSVEVRYSDLDLQSESGAAALQQRVKRAVVRVCGRADTRNLSEMQDVQRCRNEANARSTRDIALALEGARSGERLASLTVEK